MKSFQRQTDDKLLSKPIIVPFTDAIYAWLRLNELIIC